MEMIQVQFIKHGMFDTFSVQSDQQDSFCTKLILIEFIVVTERVSLTFLSADLNDQIETHRLLEINDNSLE
jgi:hypothetical protein